MCNIYGRLICKALNDLHNIVLLGQITFSNTRRKCLTKTLKHCGHSHNKIFILYYANFKVSFLFGIHYNVLLELITINNTRSEGVTENITTLCNAHASNKIIMYACKISCFLVFQLLTY